MINEQPWNHGGIRERAQGHPLGAAIAEPAARETDRLFEKIPFGANTDAELSCTRSCCTECNFISAVG